MLRRILVPFSELFIVLALMFVALFVITAALVGKGDARPEDDIHIIKITWRQDYALHRKSAGSDFGAAAAIIETITRVFWKPDLILEATDFVTLSEFGHWQYAWTDSGSAKHNAGIENSISIADACVLRHKESGHAYISDFSSIALDLHHPNQVLRALSGSAANSKLTATISSSTITNAGPNRHNQTNNLTISYRPEDVNRPVLLRVGTKTMNLSGKGSTRDVNEILYYAETLGKDRLQQGKVYVDDDGASAKWERGTGPSQLYSDYPLSYWDDSCKTEGRLFLYVLVKSDGVTFHSDIPEI
ncbi:hypothetical protein [Phaeobacter inhibens]|uniref:hypothetical protein n=1 Tax=Phaeobacter inhibens TaxID=221822 RepID=UPI0021A47750|nr:hypothetical protein [Phaeobacter inhibens]UWS07077.1 hypothetical protein K4K98_12615 [Phaeobacter inhibens]